MVMIMEPVKMARFLPKVFPNLWEIQSIQDYIDR